MLKVAEIYIPEILMAPIICEELYLLLTNQGYAGPVGVMTVLLPQFYNGL